MGNHRPPPHAVVIAALLALAATMTGFSVASPGGGEKLSALGTAAKEHRAALGARRPAPHRHARRALGPGLAMSPTHGEGQSAIPGGESQAGSPALVTAAPAPASSPSPDRKAAAKTVPEPEAEAAPPAPAGPEPPAPTPPATPEVEPEPVAAPEPEPVAAPEPEPVVPPEPEPVAAPEPETAPKSTSGAGVGVELEPQPEPEPAVSTGSLVIGIDGGYAGWSESESVERAELGAAVTRHEFDPAEAVDNQDALVLKAASQVHTRIHALLGGNALGDPAHYREWVVAFIRRYGAGGSFWSEHPELDASRYAITSFELGNEPYFGAMSAGEYADTVRPTLEEVKRLGLPAKIVLPSRAYGTDTSWIDTLYQRIPNLNSLFYAFADHPYWYGHDPAEVSAAGPFGRIETLRRRMDELGASSKPIWITEYGESTASCGGECVSEAVQAEHLEEMVEAVVSHSAWKVEVLLLFQLLDRGTASPDRELQFGLLRQDGTPKPSYAIVHGAMQQYR